MELSYLLSQYGIDTEKSPVLVMRHVPTEPGVRKALPWLAAERPDIFNAYQESQRPDVEKQLANADYLASFIGQRSKEAVFVGLYKIAGRKPISHAGYWKVPANIELKKLGMRGWEEEKERPHALQFSLELTDFGKEWKGKLIVGWPPPERSWTRWADRNEFPVKAILEESVLDKGMQPWDELVLTWEELAHLPKSWIGALTQWRGIYFILDAVDGKGYVGSASGDENLYGRWANYATSGHGGNKRLRSRRPQNLLFSILQRLSPDVTTDEAVRIESTWKDRLHTRQFGLNEN